MSASMSETFSQVGSAPLRGQRFLWDRPSTSVGQKTPRSPYGPIRSRQP